MVVNTRTGQIEDDLVLRGFYITQSEVGNKVAVFYLWVTCCNRTMWGVEGFEEIRSVT